MTVPTTGCELELFADAIRWKAYLARSLAPFIGGDVLEVGAGIGSTTAVLRSCADGSWTALEPDEGLFTRLGARLEGGGQWTVDVSAVHGTVGSLADDVGFDTIVYIDVLEHISDDRSEVERAAAHLAPGGRLVTLSPAHPFLMSEFDRAIGHYRRYDLRSLRRLSPPGCHLEAGYYLDSAGMILSLGNRLLLRRSLPTAAQIRWWDRRVVPVSRVLDRLLWHRLGKSVVAVWRRDATGPGR